MKTKILASAFALILFVSNVSAQIVVDLSKGNVTSETIGINLKPTLIIKNMVCPREGLKYSLSIDLEQHDIPAIPLSKMQAKRGVSDPNDTLPYSRALSALKEEQQESGIPQKIILLQKEIDRLKPEYPVLKQEGDIAILSTTYVKDLQFALSNNQTIVVNVKREMTENGKIDSVTWKFTFKTPSKSPLSVMYGFTFIPNMMNPIVNYYSQADTSGKLFTVTQLNNDRKDFLKNISPTLMITWKPLKKYACGTGKGKGLVSNNFYQLGLVAGLSLNFASETGTVNVLAGPSIIIADNVSLSAGVALTQKSVLKGQYKDGDIIKEDLDFDQLHEKKYMGEWFVSLAIRFEQNPFSKKEDSKDK
ncbi:MAG TPA: hypothetical protein VF868_13630 [Bacteroidia bacterium]|jgi:hypothetical protein